MDAARDIAYGGEKYSINDEDAIRKKLEKKYGEEEVKKAEHAARIERAIKYDDHDSIMERIGEHTGFLIPEFNETFDDPFDGKKNVERLKKVMLNPELRNFYAKTYTQEQRRDMEDKGILNYG